MLNPTLDVDLWTRLSYSLTEISQPSPTQDETFFDEGIKPRGLLNKKVVKSAPKVDVKKIRELATFLNSRVVGQPEAIEAVQSALKRSHAGLKEDGRPIGVFMFAGASGVGKTHLARELHKYLFGHEYDLVRVDCGEFQLKYENQKILGAPPGYIGHNRGSQLTDSLIEHPHTVVLFDEAEKAHPDFWHTFLRAFDEGILTDSKNRTIDFTNAIIIMTTNLGNDKIVDGISGGSVGFGGRTSGILETTEIPRYEMVEKQTIDCIKKHFKPEFLNRIDKMVVFNYLTPQDLIFIADLELNHLRDRIAKKGLDFTWTSDALDALAEKGRNSVKGVRYISQVRREQIEELLANRILETDPQSGKMKLDYENGSFTLDATFVPKLPLKTIDVEFSIDL
jgi:ATP-dependent Clp protease ATP-binding subunit ClpC